MNQRQLRNALSQYATGVIILTAKGNNDELIGLTMTSFNSVSMDPPLILFSVITKSFSLETLKKADAFTVNVLSQGQEKLSNQFAKAGGDKWQNISYNVGFKGVPRLINTIAYFECSPYACYEGGDHLIFLGKVENFSVSATKDPLLFFRGRYHSTNIPLEETGWPLSAHY